MEILESVQLRSCFKETGCFHHERIDLLDRCIAIASEALTFSLRLDDTAVHNTGEQQEATNQSRLFSIVILQVLTHKHTDNHCNTGTCTTSSRRYNNDTKSMLQLKTVLQEKLINCLVEFLDFAALNSRIQCKTRNCTNLSCSLRYCLGIENCIVRKPVFHCIVVVVKIIQYTLCG